MTRALLRRLDELERRQAPASARSAKDELGRRLEAMAARLRAAPDWREPTPEETAEATAAVRAFFAAKGWLWWPGDERELRRDAAPEGEVP